jgi:predicted nucleic acid-binding protein
MPVLDTSVLVGVQRGEPAAERLHRRLEKMGGTLWIPSVAWMEYLAGIPPVHHAAFDDALDEFATIAVFDRAAALAAARMQYLLLRAGKRKGWTDIQIAAVAYVLAEPLATTDNDFDDIPGIQVLHP